jgi:chaperonin GroES
VTAKKVTVKISPLADRVLIKPTPKEDVSKGGIFLPDTAKEKPQEGQIVAVGPGRLTEDGKRIAMEVTAGDKVIYAKYAGMEIKIDGEEYLIVRESDILGKL